MKTTLICEEMSLDSIPKDMRGLRACKMCSMVKVTWLYLMCVCVLYTHCIKCGLQTFDQFLFGGCDNCERYLRMKGNRERVTEVTSSNFDG